MKRTALLLLAMLMYGCAIRQPHLPAGVSTPVQKLHAILETAQAVIPLIGNLTAPQQQQVRTYLGLALTCVDESAASTGPLVAAQACATAASATLPPGLPQAAATALAAVLQAVREFVGPPPSVTGRARPTVEMNEADKRALPKLRREAAKLRGKL